MNHSSSISNIINVTRKLPQLQFEILDSILRKGQTSVNKDNFSLFSTASSLANDDENSTTATLAILPDLYLQPSEMNSYLQLFATYKPSELCYYLMTHDNYNIDDVLLIVKSKHIFDSIIYLLDKIGEINTAIEYCQIEITNYIQILLKDVETAIKSKMKNNIISLNGMITEMNLIVSDNNGTNLRNDILNSINYKNFDRVIKISIEVCSKSSSTSNTNIHWFAVLDHLLKEKCK